jgi:hypothetical protein
MHLGEDAEKGGGNVAFFFGGSAFANRLRGMAMLRKEILRAHFQFVIASAAKQSRGWRVMLDCFAALAMTMMLRNLCLARGWCTYTCSDRVAAPPSVISAPRQFAA